MKKLAPVLLALLAASLWSWSQRARNPLVLATQANCSLHGVHLGDSQGLVFQALGPPGASI